VVRREQGLPPTIEVLERERLMSVRVPGSDVVRLNEAAGVQPVPVSRDTREVLLKRIASWTSAAASSRGV